MSLFCSGMVGELSIIAEAGPVTAGGDYGSENVGISNKKSGENPDHRKPKVSWAIIIIPGLGDPKLRPKGVGDGQQVNIPALI